MGVTPEKWYQWGMPHWFCKQLVSHNLYHQTLIDLQLHANLQLWMASSAFFTQYDESLVCVDISENKSLVLFNQSQLWGSLVWGYQRILPVFNIAQEILLRASWCFIDDTNVNSKLLQSRIKYLIFFTLQFFLVLSF